MTSVYEGRLLFCWVAALEKDHNSFTIPDADSSLKHLHAGMVPSNESSMMGPPEG